MSFFERMAKGDATVKTNSKRRRSAVEPPTVRGSWLGRVFLSLIQDVRTRQAFGTLSEIYRRARLDRWSREMPRPTGQDLAAALRVADWAVLERRNSPVAWAEVFLALFLDEGAADESRNRMGLAMEEAMRRAPRWAEGWCMLAAYYRSMPKENEHFRAGRSACEHALALNAEDEWALVEKAMLFNKYGDLSGEKLAYEELVHHYPDNEGYRAAYRELLTLRPDSSVVIR